MNLLLAIIRFFFFLLHKGKHHHFVRKVKTHLELSVQILRDVHLSNKKKVDIFCENIIRLKVVTTSGRSSAVQKEISQ